MATDAPLTGKQNPVLTPSFATQAAELLGIMRIPKEDIFISRIVEQQFIEKRMKVLRYASILRDQIIAIDAYSHPWIFRWLSGKLRRGFDFY